MRIFLKEIKLMWSRYAIFSDQWFEPTKKILIRMTKVSDSELFFFYLVFIAVFQWLSFSVRENLGESSILKVLFSISRV